MASTRVEVQAVGDILRFSCSGLLDPAGVAALLGSARTAIEQHPATRGVIVVTSSVTDCAEAAKKDLVGLQRVLADGGRRTAWIDERARFRGIALWVMHLADDANGKAVSNLEQAEHWLRSSEAREASARRGVGR